MPTSRLRTFRIDAGRIESDILPASVRIVFHGFKNDERQRAIVELDDHQLHVLHDIIWKVTHKREQQAARLRAMAAAEPPKEP